MALNLAGEPGKEKRRELDFYPTPANVTLALMEFLKLPRNTLIWEPACGDGAMVKVLVDLGYYVTQSDISMGLDYLTTPAPTSFRANAIITNPPFNLSHLFIEKAISEAPIVAMLLKSQYWHAASRLKLFEKHPPTWVLPLTWRPDFLAHIRTGGRPTMEVAWSVWIKGDSETKYLPLQKPKP